MNHILDLLRSLNIEVNSAVRAAAQAALLRALEEASANYNNYSDRGTYDPQAAYIVPFSQLSKEEQDDFIAEIY